MTYVRKTTSDGHPLTLWHVAMPAAESFGARLTGCGRVYADRWPDYGTGWSYYRLSDDLPPREERCTANGCRQRWETT